MGLEPTTFSLGSWHSTTELRPRQIICYRFHRLDRDNFKLEKDYIMIFSPALPHSWLESRQKLRVQKDCQTRSTEAEAQLIPLLAKKYSPLTWDYSLFIRLGGDEGVVIYKTWTLKYGHENNKMMLLSQMFYLNIFPHPNTYGSDTRFPMHSNHQAEHLVSIFDRVSHCWCLTFKQISVHFPLSNALQSA